MATHKEMKTEALSRMRAIQLYDGTIEAFKEDMVHVYEPPYGCSYSIEEDDEDYIRAFEQKDGVLVWGVIRTSSQSRGRS